MSLYYNSLNFIDSVKLIFFAFVSLFRKEKINYENYFIKSFSNLFKKDNFICTPSARSGLYAILSQINLKKNDEVIVCGFTCSAVIEPILLLKAKPIYTDISKKTYTQTMSSIKNKITKKTKVVIIQHTFGFYAPIHETISFLKNKNIFIIEDCALSIGNKLNNVFLGTIGDAAIYSFELSKTISVGWGGGVMINNDFKLFRKIKKKIENQKYQSKLLVFKRLFQAGISSLLINFKIPSLIKWFVFGFFYKIKFFIYSSDFSSDDLRKCSDYQWKILLNQLLRLDKILNNNSLNAHLYDSILKRYSINIDLPKDVKLMRLPLLVRDKDKAINFFKKNGIEIGSWFSNPVSDSKLSPDSFKYINGQCPNSEFICKHIINLPLNNFSNKSDFNKNLNCLSNFLDTFIEEVNFMKKVYS